MPRDAARARLSASGDGHAPAEVLSVPGLRHDHVAGVGAQGLCRALAVARRRHGLKGKAATPA